MISCCLNLLTNILKLVCNCNNFGPRHEISTFIPKARISRDLFKWCAFCGLQFTVSFCFCKPSRYWSDNAWLYEFAFGVVKIFSVATAAANYYKVIIKWLAGWSLLSSLLLCIDTYLHYCIGVCLNVRMYIL